MRHVDGDDGRQPVTAVLVGLGKLGLTVAEGLIARSDVRIVAAVDVDPAKQGADLGTVVGAAPIGVTVTTQLPDEARDADVAVLMTHSRMAALIEPIAELLDDGVNVLTSAEELAYPWREFPQESERLDALARERNVTLLGAGANPGFLMDALPVALSVTTQQLRRLKVVRSMDLRPHRAARLRRFALGTDPERFTDISPAVVHGHIGFRQSIDAVADALGLPVDRVEEIPPRPSVVASEPRIGHSVVIERGQVAVVSQGAVGLAGEEPVITLEEHFGFLDEDDDIPQGDTWVLDGVDQRFTVTVTPGVLSFVTTPAVLINMIVPVVNAEPGLLSTLDFAVRDLASKGQPQVQATPIAS